MPVQQRVQFAVADSPQARVNKLTQLGSSVESRLAALEQRMSEMVAARPAVVRKNTSGGIIFDGLSGAGVVRRGSDGLVSLYQPLEVTEWQDYFAQCNPQGWAAGVAGVVWYCKIGTMCFVAYAISGTSNDTAASIELPYPVRVAGTDLQTSCRGIDNGIVQVQPSLAFVTNGTRLAEFLPTMSLLSTWANVGVKSVEGELFYRTMT